MWITVDDDFKIFIYDIVIRKSTKPTPIAWFPKGITLDQSIGGKVEYKYTLAVNQHQSLLADQQVKMASIQVLPSFSSCAPRITFYKFWSLCDFSSCLSMRRLWFLLVDWIRQRFHWNLLPGKYKYVP
jgi:hypothetical protein